MSNLNFDDYVDYDYLILMQEEELELLSEADAPDVDEEVAA